MPDSDYPMLATHEGIDLRSPEFVAEVGESCGEFDGLAALEAPVDARHCSLSLHLCATLSPRRGVLRWGSFMSARFPTTWCSAHSGEFP